MDGAAERSANLSPDKGLQTGAGETGSLSRNDDFGRSPHPRPLGKRQLERLLGLANPCHLLVVGDGPVIASLVKRGMLAPKKGDPKAWLQITPAGMRTLAAAFEHGLLDQFFNWPKGLA